MSVSQMADRGELFKQATVSLNSVIELISATVVDLNGLLEVEHPRSVEDILWRLNSAASKLSQCRAKVIEATSPEVLSDALHSMLSP